MLWLLLMGALLAEAITYGRDDGEDHPYVCLSVLFVNGQPVGRCSGTFISPRVFLTAGHCAESDGVVGETARIWCNSEVGSVAQETNYPFGDETIPSGTPVLNPNYIFGAFYVYDSAVIIMDEPVILPSYGALPDLLQMDEISPQDRRNSFTAVGYGLQDISPIVVRELTRKAADLQLTLPVFDGPTGPYNCAFSGNAATGGTCFGDSGGPEFFIGTNVIGSVTSFGFNSQCGGIGGGYRIDSMEELMWIQSFLEEPEGKGKGQGN